ncbi:hypothetical protein NP233_g1829 [Leucocoprinus birnbaumii]|uniref:Uncharacterized protein n=1 Tax=Leucocoprinus birnbaumii TaxID=56174 RepID=A0AAD5YUH5_9AGAR|nr:hypothetical protein NP233_g1829 [Leucocoprinus birnbaumii]
MRSHEPTITVTQAVAIIELAVSFTPGGSFFGGHTINFGIPYYSITIGLNIIITALICFRLLKMSRALGGVLGRESSDIYANVVAILVESAAPYSVVGIMFLIPYGLGSDTFIGFGQVWAKLTCLSPQLIVLRVVSGKAWKRRSITEAAQTSIKFEHSGKTGGTAQVELPERKPANLNFAVRVTDSVDDDYKSPQESTGSTFAGSPIDNWKHWETSSSGVGKLDV